MVILTDEEMETEKLCCVPDITQLLSVTPGPAPLLSVLGIGRQSDQVVQGPGGDSWKNNRTPALWVSAFCDQTLQSAPQ